MNFVDQRTFRCLPFHSPAFDLIIATSWPSSLRNAAKSVAAVVLACFSGGDIIKKDSSVSISADRELRFVDPKRVKIGGVKAFGDSHKPSYEVRSGSFRCHKPHLSHDTSNLVFPIRSIAPRALRRHRGR